MFHVKNECDIAVFARAPVAGRAKTRLIPMLGAEGAANLHAHLTEHTLSTVTRAGLGAVTLWCAGDPHDLFFRQCAADFDLVLREQTSGDLGERMLAVFEQAGSRPTLLIGTDCPSITIEHLRACADALHGGADAVFLPAEDGGYGLVGLASPVRELFRDMTWSTDAVMQETRSRLRALNLNWREPATIWDVDRPEDVSRLIACGLLGGWRPDSLDPSIQRAP
jgi:rSAM/selenodomain-associated transferase 1